MKQTPPAVKQPAAGVTVRNASLTKINEQSLRERSPSLFQFNEKLFQDPSRLYQFRKFVEKEYADENLLFYLEVEQYRGLATDGARRERGREIVEKFIAPDAERLINIEASVLKKTRQLWEAKELTTVFDAASEEVWKLMKLDSYQRFSRSVFFEAMLTGRALKEESFGEEVFVKFMELCTGRDLAWQPVKKKGDVELFEQNDSKGHHLIKGVLELNAASQDVANVLEDVAACTRWDKDCVGAYEIERYSERFSAFYIAYKSGLFRADNIDFVLAQVTRQFTDGTICIINRSIPLGDELVPEKKSFKRCHMETGGWMVESIGQSRIRITSIQEVIYSDKAEKRSQDAIKSRKAALNGLKDFVQSAEGQKQTAQNRRKSVIM